MADYLLDTNAYFAIIKYITSKQNIEEYERVLSGNCYISKLTQIEIVSVIGKHARGASKSIQICERIHEGESVPCGKRYVDKARKKWTTKTVHDWLKLEQDISSGRNSKFNVTVLDVDSNAISAAQKFISNALKHDFKSMDAMILGTAQVNSKDDRMIVVTADKGLKAGMDRINYPHISFTQKV